MEGLETRWMLAGDTGTAMEQAVAAEASFESGWPGFLLADQNGNVMVADVEGTLQADLLATSSVTFYDIAISSSGRVLGVSNGVGESSILYELGVDFNNPGGSGDLTAIGSVATNLNGVVLNGLEFAPDGTLLGTGYDYNGSNLGNYLYSIDENTGSATHLVNLGGYQSGGDVAVDEEGAAYIPSSGGALLRIPSDYSGYSVVGNIGFSDVYGLTYGPGPDLRGYRPGGEVLNIDTSDASWVDEGTLVPGSTVPYPAALLGASTVFEPPTDLGEVAYAELTGQTPILETLWYRFDTMYDGYASVELFDLSSEAGVQMTLHHQDVDGNLEVVATGTTRVDDLSAVAGDRYFVEITGLRSPATVHVVNQIELGTDTLTVHGSDQNDELVVDIGSPYVVTINGIDYRAPFDAGTFVTTTFDGGGGVDQIQVLGSTGDDTADIDIATRSGTFAGTDFEVDSSSTEVMEFDGRDGHDTASILGTDADSQLQLAPFQGAIVEGADQGSALETEEITIDAAGGNNQVDFSGGSKNDRLDLNPTSGTYQEYVPSGEVRDPTYFISADNIQSNYATSGGGIDAVFLRDSDGDESFVSGLGLATYKGPGYSQEIHGFREVYAYGMNGGNDKATMYDTTATDKLKTNEEFSILRGGGFYYRAKGFETVAATSLYGGDDYAVFSDTPGDDLLTASYASATMTDGTIVREATGFKRVLVRATTGFDTARLEDSPGDDVFLAHSHKSLFFSRKDDSYDLTVRAFDQVYADSVYGGNDIAKLHDTPGDDDLTGTGDVADFYQDTGGNLDLLYEVMGFETVKVYWTTGTNTKDITPPIDYSFIEMFL